MKIKKLISTVIAASAICANVTLPVRAAELALTTDSVYGIYESGDALSYTLSGNATVSITDYFGNSYELGSYSDGAKITTPITKVGAYTITATSGSESVSQRFAVMPKLSERRASENTPISFASMATHTDGKKDHIDDYMRTIKLAGVNYVREFIPADGTIKGLGDYDWTARGTNYHKLCDLMDAYAKNDIGVMLMYQNMITGGPEMPEDLYLVYDYTKALCKQFEGKMDAVEILNETEGFGSNNTEGPEQYAALLKAAAIGAKDSGTGVKIVMTALTGGKKEYAENLARNMTDTYYDVYNGHYYDDYEADKNIAVFPHDPGEYNATQSEFGVSNKPLWMTEFGLRIPFEEGLVDLTAAQQKQQARTAPVSFIGSLASGTDRLFWFLHGYINENKKSYGDFGSDNKPYAAYNSISAFIDALGNGVYEGEVQGLPDGVNAHTFKDGNETMLAIWSENEATVNVTASNAELINIMGNSEAFSGGSLTVGPDIQYIRAVGDIKVNSATAVKASFPKKVEVSSDIKESDRIVLIPEFPESSRDVAKDAYQLSDTNEIGVTVFNFTNEEKTGNVTASSQGGWVATNPKQQVTVPAMGSAKLVFNVNKTSSVVNQVKSALIFGGTFDGEVITDSVAFVKSRDFVTGTVAQFKYPKWAEYPSGTTKGGTITDLGDQSDGSRAYKYDFTKVAAGERKGSAVGIMNKYNYSNTTIDLSGNEGFAFSVKADRAIGDIGTRIWVTDGDGDSFYTHTNLNYDTIQAMKTINVDNSTYRQAVFAVSDLRCNSQKGDGKLDMSKIKGIYVGFSMYETVNGNATTSADQIDTDNFTIYIKDICAVPTVAFGNKASVDLAPTVEYVDNKLFTTMEGSAKYVKHLINGEQFIAEAMGNVAQLPIFLKAGSYEITTTAFNTSNKPFTQTQTIEVTRDNEYFVEYEADGATNVPETQIKYKDTPIKLSEQIPTKKDAIFIGWTTEMNGTEVEYRAGEEYAENADVVLYPVWFKWEGEKTALLYKNAALLNSADKYAIVKGSDSELAGKDAAVLVYRVTAENNGNAEDIADGDIVYIDEISIDSDGNYAFSFPFDLSGEFKYVLRLDNSAKQGTFDDVEVNYKWIDAASHLSLDGTKARVWIKVRNHAKGAASYSTILASENKDGLNLISWEDVAAPAGLSDNVGITTVSADLETLKLMVWSDDYKLIPIAPSTTVTK